MPFSTGNIINFLNPAAPKGLIDSAEDWVRHRRRKDDIRVPQPSAWCRKLGDETEVILHDPGLGVAGDYLELPNVRWTVAPDSKLFYISGARILGSEAVVIAPDNRVFREFSYPPSRSWLDHSCFKRRRIPPIQVLNGWFATVSYPSSRFYFHWILESLPRMKLLGDYLSILDGVFVSDSMLPFHQQSLAALGIPSHKLISVSPSTHFKVQHLFVPKYCAFYNPAAWLHRWYKEAFLGTVAARGSGSGLKKIYVSRADANVRRVRNENEIINYLTPLGFDAVTLTNMDFLEQARLFFNADVIIAPHGAGLANIVFCNVGTRILEICSPNWMPPCYFAIAKSAELSYSYMVADECPTSPSLSSSQTLDITVSLEVLRRHVDQLLTHI